MTEAEDKFDDPFSVGQLVGMLVVLTYIEKNRGIPRDFCETLMDACAERSAAFLEKPKEDIYLMVDNLVKDIKEI